MSAPICKCGRPRYTSGDMDRWLNEQARHVAAGGKRDELNPEWARSICWAMHDVACNLKPIVKVTTQQETLRRAALQIGALADSAGDDVNTEYLVPGMRRAQEYLEAWSKES